MATLNSINDIVKFINYLKKDKVFPDGFSIRLDLNPILYQELANDWSLYGFKLKLHGMQFFAIEINKVEVHIHKKYNYNGDSVENKEKPKNNNLYNFGIL